MRTPSFRPSHPFRPSHLLLVAIAFLTLGVGVAQAQSLDELRAAGKVGERFDGFAVVRASDASDEVKTLVAEVNSKRRAIYEERAAQEKVAADQVGRVYAKQIWESSPAGVWFLLEAGDWVQKPAPGK